MLTDNRDGAALDRIGYVVVAIHLITGDGDKQATRSDQTRVIGDIFYFDINVTGQVGLL